jgi:hypothetical protein
MGSWGALYSNLFKSYNNKDINHNCYAWLVFYFGKGAFDGLAHLTSLPSQNKYGYFEIIDPNQRFHVNKSLKEGKLWSCNWVTRMESKACRIAMLMNLALWN